MTATAARTIRVGHSPDPDDAFMFYALAKDKLNTGELRFEHQLIDIETLNRWALEDARLEITAVSLHAYAYLADKYSLLDMGSSLGHGYGPILVVKPGTTREQALAGPIAIPGKLTTAYLTAQLWAGSFPHKEVPFETVMDEVAEGRATAGLVIHEGQLTYPELGLEVLVDLGKWWADETGGLPLPLGVNVVRRDLGPELMKRIAGLLHESIVFALEHRDDALSYAMEYGRGLDRARADRFVDMYVNQSTLTLGDTGEKAVRLLLERAHAAGIIPHEVAFELIRR